MSGETKTRVAVIGAGRFGARRAVAVACHRGSSVVLVADIVGERARSVAAQIGCAATSDWKEAATREDVDVVVVSTPTGVLSKVARAALEAGKHVLCEKPFGRRADEVLPVVELARRKRLRLKIGYNHRYHPAIQKAHSLFVEGAVGRPHFLRCLYGHGGRPGYDQEWRSQTETAGGGQLLDQGVHALDLFQWFLGEFQEVKAFATTAFWQIAPLEDNIYALLRTPESCVASLHASWTNWKNVFSLELFGEEGFLAVSGLGGSYGPGRLCWGRRLALGVRPEEQWFEFPGEDRSLACEWDDFVNCIIEGREPQSNGQEGWRTLKLAEAIYCAALEYGAVPMLVTGLPALKAPSAGELERQKMGGSSILV